MKEMLIKRNPNPYTFNYQYVVVLDRLKGTIFELDGDMAAFYQILRDDYTSLEELSRIYEETWGKPLDPALIKKLESQEGLIHVKFRE